MEELVGFRHAHHDDIARFRAWVDEAAPRSMVFFGGAGVSTESGIPDFRGSGGMFKQKYPYPAEVMVSRSFFDSHTREFYEFYCENMLFPDAKPNQAHRKLAELEAAHILTAVITQNVDGLHQKAGSRNVIELHGSVQRNFCMGCHSPYSFEDFLRLRAESDDGVSRCPRCGDIIKPDVVLYEEPLDEKNIVSAVSEISRADLLVIAGTSLIVNPAASLVDYFNGKHLAIVNKSPTPKDRSADLCIAADVGEVFAF